MKEQHQQDLLLLFLYNARVRVIDSILSLFHRRGGFDYYYKALLASTTTIKERSEGGE